MKKMIDTGLTRLEELDLMIAGTIHKRDSLNINPIYDNKCKYYQEIVMKLDYLRDELYIKEKRKKVKK